MAGKSEVLAAKKENFQLLAGELQFKALPNPSASYFTVKVSSSSAVPVDIRLIDATGRVVEQVQNIATTSTLTMGRNLRPGTYYLEGVQGKERQSVKLLKTPE